MRTAGPVRLFSISQWVKTPLRAALAVCVSLVAVAVSGRVALAGAVLVAQALGTVCGVLGSRTKTAEDLGTLAVGSPLLRCAVWAIGFVALWQAQTACAVGRDSRTGEVTTTSTPGSCISDRPAISHGVAYAITALLAFLDGAATGVMAEVDISVGGLGVAASVLGFEVTAEHITDARSVWDRCLLLSYALVAAACVGAVELQQWLLSSATPVSVAARPDNVLSSLTIAPVLLAAVFAAVTAITSATVARVMYRRYARVKLMAESGLAAVSPERTRSHFRMSLADALIDHSEDPQTPGRPADVIDVLHQRIRFSPDSDLEEFRSDTRLVETLRAASDSRFRRGSDDPSGSDMDLGTTRRSLDFGGVNFSNDLSATPTGSRDSRAVVDVGDTTSDEDDEDDTGLGKGCRPVPRPGRRIARQLRSGMRLLRKHPYVAAVMTTGALEVAVQDAILMLFVPVCCIELPFIAGAPKTVPKGSAAELPKWNIGLAPGLLWAAGICLMMILARTVGNIVGGRLHRRLEEESDLKGLEGYGRAQKSSIVRLSLMCAAFVATLGTGAADVLYHDGVVPRWGAVALFAGSLVVYGFTQGVAMPTTVAMQFEACIDLPQRRSIFAAATTVVHVCQAIAAATVAGGLDDSELLRVITLSDATVDYDGKVWAALGAIMCIAVVDVVMSLAAIYRRFRLDQETLDVQAYDDQFDVPPRRSMSDLSECSTTAGPTPIFAVRAAITPRHLQPPSARLRTGSTFETPRRRPVHGDPAAQYLSPRVESELVAPKTGADFRDE